MFELIQPNQQLADPFFTFGRTFLRIAWFNRINGFQRAICRGGCQHRPVNIDPILNEPVQPPYHHPVLVTVLRFVRQYFTD